jgi:hypothetical protein
MYLNIYYTTKFYKVLFIKKRKKPFSKGQRAGELINEFVLTKKEKVKNL